MFKCSYFWKILLMPLCYCSLNCSDILTLENYKKKEAEMEKLYKDSDVLAKIKNLKFYPGSTTTLCGIEYSFETLFENKGGGIKRV